MVTKKISSLSKLKNEYPEIYSEIEDSFSDNNKKLKNYELDYFEHNQKKDEFCLSMSCGVGEDLEIFDMSGEYIEEEVNVIHSGFSKLEESEDLYDSDRVDDFFKDDDHDIEN